MTCDSANDRVYSLTTAQQNADTIKNLRLGMMIACGLSFFLRVLLRRSSLRPTAFAFWVYALSLVPSIFLSRYLERIGSPRRDPTTGALISAGEDLSRPGIIEWCFDVVYITWACQIGSGAFGEWVWWLYLVVSPPPFPPAKHGRGCDSEACRVRRYRYMPCSSCGPRSFPLCSASGVGVPLPPQSPTKGLRRKRR